MGSEIACDGVAGSLRDAVVSGLSGLGFGDRFRVLTWRDGLDIWVDIADLLRSDMPVVLGGRVRGDRSFDVLADYCIRQCELRVWADGLVDRLGSHLSEIAAGV